MPILRPLRGLNQLAGKWLSDRRQVVVESNVELDIDLGDGSVRGEI